MPLNTLVAGTLSDGRIQLFATTQFGLSDEPVAWSAWKLTPDPNSEWTDWSQFTPGNPAGFSISRFLAAANRPNGALQVFAATSPEPTSVGKIITTWKASSDPNSEWVDWQSFFDWGDGGNGSLAVGALSDGRLQAFVLPLDGSFPLMTAWMEDLSDNPRWTPVIPFEPLLPSRPNSHFFWAGATVAPIFLLRLQLWISAGIDGHLWSTWKESADSDSPWVGWSEFFAPPFMTQVGQQVGRISAGRLTDGRVQLWAPGESEGQSLLYTAWQEELATDSPWAAWVPFLPLPSGVQPEGGFRVVETAQLSDGRLQLWTLVLGPSGPGLITTWKLTGDPNSNWAGWSEFPMPQG